MDGLADAEVQAILDRTTRVAVVGASSKPERPSFGVMASLIAHGFEVVPVNPGLEGSDIHGRRVAASLEAAGPLDMVDVFRAPDAVGPLVDEAIRLGARTIWMQLGVINETAAARARKAGLAVVMDRCPKIEFARLGYRRRAG